MINRICYEVKEFFFSPFLLFFPLILTSSPCEVMLALTLIFVHFSRVCMSLVLSLSIVLSLCATARVMLSILMYKVMFFRVSVTLVFQLYYMRSVVFKYIKKLIINNAPVYVCVHLCLKNAIALKPFFVWGEKMHKHTQCTH